MTDLPKMDVEFRVSNDAHGVLAPNNEDLHEDLAKIMVLNHQAVMPGWQDKTLDILVDNIPVETNAEELKNAIEKVTGFTSWGQVSFFVEDDMCSEFFNMALKYVLREGQKHKKDKGFIDGTGLGYLGTFKKRCRETLDKCFDAKYKYQEERPISYAWKNFVLDLSPIANAIHPGHWSYPAGHGTKFLTTVEVLDDMFSLDKQCYKNIFLAACGLAHGRSGLLIHFLRDNLAGGKLTTLKEFHD